MRYRALLAAALLSAALGLHLTDTATATPYEPAVGKAHIFNHEQASGANILTSSLTPDRFPVVAYAITVSLDTAATLQFVSTDGTTTNVDAMNGGTNLDADEVYTFVVGARSSTATSGQTISYNFRIDTAAYIKRLQVDEVRSDVR